MMGCRWHSRLLSYDEALIEEPKKLGAGTAGEFGSFGENGVMTK